MAAGVKAETGVVAASPGRLVPLIGDVDEVAVHGDADRLEATRVDRAALDPRKRAIRPDAQHRDLVASRVDRQQVAAVAADLKGTLRTDDGPGTLTARRERRAGSRRQRAVAVPVEGGDCVFAFGVVVDVDVSGHV